MFEEGVIICVTSVSEAQLAQECGAAGIIITSAQSCDSRNSSNVDRMASVDFIGYINSVIDIPIIGQCRIGHFVEAEILESLEVDFIDESEVLTPVDETYIDKSDFKVPFMCGATDLWSALNRIEEGANIIKFHGESGTGDIFETIKTLKRVRDQIDLVLRSNIKEEFLESYAMQRSVKPESIRKLIEFNGKFPVIKLASGGISTPADAAMCMNFGVDGIIVGSGIFKAEYPRAMATALVETVKSYGIENNVMRKSIGIGEPFKGRVDKH